MAKKLRRFCCWALLLGNLVLVLLVVTPLQNRLYALLEVPAQARPAEVIILLSSGDFRLGQFEAKTYQRMQHAKKLYDQGLAGKILICGGVLRAGEESIARKMAAYMIACGIPEERILLEENSHNTYENILFARDVLTRERLGTALLVTSASHMWRSWRICRNLGLRVFPMPVPCYEKQLETAAERWQHLRELLREFGAIVYFQFRGWI